MELCYPAMDAIRADKYIEYAGACDVYFSHPTAVRDLIATIFCFCFIEIAYEYVELFVIIWQKRNIPRNWMLY